MKKKLSPRLIQCLNAGIFPAYVSFCVGFGYDEIQAHYKRVKAKGWSEALKDSEEVVRKGSWLATKSVWEKSSGERVNYYFIIVPKRFDFNDDEDYLRLAHECVHICQFLLPDVLDRNKELECEAYLHTHLMRQCLQAMRSK